MLPKKHRLPLRDRIIPELQVHNDLFSLKMRKNSTDTSRFAFIVSKRIARLAVDRNSTKRVLRQCLQEQLIQVKPGYDMLFVAKKALRMKDRASVCKEIDRELMKKSLLSN